MAETSEVIQNQISRATPTEKPPTPGSSQEALTQKIAGHSENARNIVQKVMDRMEAMFGKQEAPHFVDAKFPDTQKLTLESPSPIDPSNGGSTENGGVKPITTPAGQK